MPPPNWIICERTNRWAAAIRHRSEIDPPVTASPRIVETRNLVDAAGALHSAPSSVVAVEVRRQNLAEVLPWLARMCDLFCRARFVALLDHSLDIPSDEEERNPGTLELVETTLREAGALDVARSPRNLRAVLEMSRRHFQSQAPISLTAESSPIQRVWDSLPWQAG